MDSDQLSLLWYCTMIGSSISAYWRQQPITINFSVDCREKIMFVSCPLYCVNISNKRHHRRISMLNYKINLIVIENNNISNSNNDHHSIVWFKSLADLWMNIIGLQKVSDLINFGLLSRKRNKPRSSQKTPGFCWLKGPKKNLRLTQPKQLNIKIFTLMVYFAKKNIINKCFGFCKTVVLIS